MKAVVYKGKSPGDSIIRINTAAICGSDLHMYDKRSNAEPGIIFRHENQGVMEEVGKGVVSINAGDRVVLLESESGYRTNRRLRSRLGLAESVQTVYG
jgi:threonine dehydrogenase-like Zn-dependent dehydrogenase